MWQPFGHVVGQGAERLADWDQVRWQMLESEVLQDRVVGHAGERIANRYTRVTVGGVFPVRRPLGCEATRCRARHLWPVINWLLAASGAVARPINLEPVGDDVGEELAVAGSGAGGSVAWSAFWALVGEAVVGVA